MQDTWIGSLAGAAVLMVFLFLPGFLAMTKTRLPKAMSLAVAPLLSAAFYIVLAIVYEKLGVTCTWWLLVIPGMAVAVLIAAVAGRRASSAPSRVLLVSTRGDLAILAMYIGWAVLVVVALFVRSLDGPGAFIQVYDNVFHLSVLQRFVEGGDWSILAVSAYDPDRINPIEVTQGFYPAGWHLMGAMVADCLGLSVPQAANVVNGVLMAVAFPASMFLLMAVLFPKNPAVVKVGAFLVLVFGAFPWFFVMWGPLFANLASFSLVPALAAVFIWTVRALLGKRPSLPGVVLFLAGGIAVACCQPNGIFTTAVFLIPFCVGTTYCTCTQKGLGSFKSLAFAAGCAVIILAIWCVAFNLPALHDVIWYDRGVGCSKAQALVNVLTLSFGAFTGGALSAQLALALAVFGGIALLLFKGRQWWLLGSYALMALIYIASASCDGFIQHFLAGFWYADPPRVSAGMVLCVVPIAAVFVTWLIARVRVVALNRFDRRRAEALAGAFVGLVFLVAVYLPGFYLSGIGLVNTAFGDVANALRYHYALFDRPLDADEEAFVEEVEELVGEDELIINQPFDGSAFASSVSGLNLYYRSIDSHGGLTEMDQSRALRLNLKDIATDDNVKEAIEEVGASYVLVLDYNEPEISSPHVYPPNVEEWAGIDGVRDDTPGFEVVLSEGDMRLYKIVDD